MAPTLVLIFVLLTPSCGEAAEDAQVRALVAQAGTHLKAGRHAEALRAFERALSIREELPTLLAIAQLQAAAGRWDDVERYLARAKKLSPLSAQVQLGLADAATVRGRWDEARALYGGLAERLPLEPTPRLLLAALTITRGDAEPALRELDSWRKRVKAMPAMRELEVAQVMLRRTLGMPTEGPGTLESARSVNVGDVERAVRMARVYLGRKEWAAAQILLEGAATQRPEPPHFVLLAAAAIENGDVETARQAIERADRLRAGAPTGPPPAEDAVLRARIDLGAGRAAAARDLLQAALGRTTDRDEDARGRLRYWLGRSLLRLGAPADARTQWQAVTEGSSAYAATQLELAQLEVAGGELDAALARLEAIAVRKAPIPVHLLLATLHEEAGRPAEAERVLRRALAQHPRETPAWLALARLLHRSGRVAPARVALAQVLQEDPTNSDALGLQAQLATSDDPVKAIALYRTLLAAHPTHAAALNNLAVLLSRSPAGLEEALALAQRAHEARPDDPRVADTLGWIHHLRGQHALARPLLETARSASPEDPEVQYHLGAALLAEGDKKRGQALLRAALSRSDAFEGRDRAEALLAGHE